LQSSPDGKDFIDEEPVVELKPGETQITTNNFFTRFARVKFNLKTESKCTGKIKIWLQGRK